MLQHVLQGKCELVVHDDRALLALQGPSAEKVLAESCGTESHHIASS